MGQLEPSWWQSDDRQAWEDDAAELVPGLEWPPPAWARHIPACFNDFGLPWRCRCGKGWK